MASATMTIRMAAEDKELIADYAKAFGESASEFMRQCALERIEDTLDLEAWRKAKAAYDADPVSYSLEEVKERLGLQ